MSDTINEASRFGWNRGASKRWGCAPMSDDLGISLMPMIALDADGVLLDYNLAYATAWRRAFGVYPRERNRHAYWAIDRWAVPRLEGDQLAHFRSCFDAQFWSSVPAIEGAVEACQRLRAAGNELVCVSALDESHAEARRNNLRALGFPIDMVVTIRHLNGFRSPKADALERLRAVAFVDDYLPYLRGVPEPIHTALIERDPVGSPNSGPEIGKVGSLHASLMDFAAWWAP